MRASGVFSAMTSSHHCKSTSVLAVLPPVGSTALTLRSLNSLALSELTSVLKAVLPTVERTERTGSKGIPIFKYVLPLEPGLSVLSTLGTTSLDDEAKEEEQQLA